MSLTDNMMSHLASKETSNAATWAIILAGGVVWPGHVNAAPGGIDAISNLDIKPAYKVSEMATSSSGSFAKIGFDDKRETDFLPDMPGKQVMKAKVIKERTMSFSPELFD